MFAATALADDIGGPEPPSFEQLFASSKIVAIVRVEAGTTGSYSSQIYRARVSDVFKGTEKGKVLYFWGGNVGGSYAYGIGQVYLVMLRDGRKPVSDVAASFSPSNEHLYESVSLNCVILLWRATVYDPPPPAPFPPDQSVFLFGCPEPAIAHGLGQGAFMFRSWLRHDEMFEYLQKLAAAEKARSHPGA